MQISIESVVDTRPLGRYRLAMLAICFLIVLMDGFDTQCIGFAAAAIAEARCIPLAHFGRMFSPGLLGSAVAAFVLGTLGERYQGGTDCVIRAVSVRFPRLSEGAWQDHGTSATGRPRLPCVEDIRAPHVLAGGLAWRTN
jgi:MFS family permease